MTDIIRSILIYTLGDVNDDQLEWLEDVETDEVGLCDILECLHKTHDITFENIVDEIIKRKSRDIFYEAFNKQDIIKETLVTKLDECHDILLNNTCSNDVYPEDVLEAFQTILRFEIDNIDCILNEEHANDILICDICDIDYNTDIGVRDYWFYRSFTSLDELESDLNCSLSDASDWDWEILDCFTMYVDEFEEFIRA